MSRTNGLMLAGVLLVFLGVAGFAVPVFTTQKTEDVIHVGDMKVEATHDVSHQIPALLSGSVLLLGFVLIGTALYQRRGN